MNDFASKGRGGLANKIIAGITPVDLRKAIIDPSTDLAPNNSATSVSPQTEANATAGWTGVDSALSSVVAHGPVAAPFDGTWFMRILGNGGAGVVGSAYYSMVTVAKTKYRQRIRVWVPQTNTEKDVTIRIGTTIGGNEIKTVNVPYYSGWNEIPFDFAATGVLTYVTVLGASNTESIYVDQASTFGVVGANGGTYIYPVGMVIVTEWQSADFLKVTTLSGEEVTLSNLASKAFQTDLYYPIPGWSSIRSSAGNESGSGDFEIIPIY